jgi:hypothetical protein
MLCFACLGSAAAMQLWLTIGDLGCGTLTGILHIAVGCSDTLSLDLGDS